MHLVIGQYEITMAASGVNQMHNFFGPYKKPNNREENVDLLFAGIGRCLTNWEIVEFDMANLYGTIIRPSNRPHGSVDSFLTIISVNQRSEMMKTSANVYFRFFPNLSLSKKFSELVKLYGRGAERRNELAHSIVAPYSNLSIDGSGYLIGPHYYSSKKFIDRRSPRYVYSCRELDKFHEEIQLFRGYLKVLCEEVVENWRNGAPTAIARY